MTEESNVARYLIKPLTVGGVAYAGQNMFISGKTITIRGETYPLAMVASVAVGVGSLFSDRT